MYNLSQYNCVHTAWCAKLILRTLGGSRFASGVTARELSREASGSWTMIEDVSWRQNIQTLDVFLFTSYC